MQICREDSAHDEAVDILHQGKTPEKKHTFRFKFKFCIQVSFKLG